MRTITMILLVICSAFAFGQVKVDDFATKVNQIVDSLSEIETLQNKWNPYITDDELESHFGYILGLHILGLGPNARDVRREVDEAILFTSLEVLPWLKPSKRQQGSRVEINSWRFKLVAGGDSPSSSQGRLTYKDISIGGEGGNAVSRLLVQGTYLPTGKTKVFRYEKSYGSINVTDVDTQSFASIFRHSKLPSFRYEMGSNTSPIERRGYVSVKLLFVKIDKEFDSTILSWMQSVLARDRAS